MYANNNTDDVVSFAIGQPPHEGGKSAIRYSAYPCPVVVRTDRFHLIPGKVVFLGNFVATMTSEVENYRVVPLYLLIVNEMFLKSG